MRASRAVAVVLLLLGLLSVQGRAAGMAREDFPGDPPLSVPLFSARPTSVLLAEPVLDTTTALSAADATYAQLSALLESDRNSIRTRRPGVGALGPPVIITWLVNDVEVARVDRVYLEAPGGPWIATEVLRAGAYPAARTGWHRSDDPDRLPQLLGELGVLDVDESTTPVAGEADPRGSPAPPAWRWGLAGLVMGALLVAMVQVLARRPAVRGVRRE